jgi:hypothetical protein
MTIVNENAMQPKINVYLKIPQVASAFSGNRMLLIEKYFQSGEKRKSILNAEYQQLSDIQKSVYANSMYNCQTVTKYQYKNEYL